MAKAYRPGDSPSPTKLNKTDSATVAYVLNQKPWRDVFSYDTFRRNVYAEAPPIALECENGYGLVKADVYAVRMWLQHKGLDCRVEDVQASIEAVARRRTFHSVCDWLATLPQTSPGVLDDLASRLLGVDVDAQPLANVFLRKFLIAAVRRVTTPGCKVDTMLILSGGQGAGKSTFLGVLFGEWFRDQLPEIGNRDGSHALEGYWGIEVAECHRFLRTDKEVVKEYLSRQVDTYRQYGNADKLEVPRQCIFAGTTNHKMILRDETGDRRSWPIEVGKIDVDTLRQLRDGVWGEAYRLASDASELHYLTEEEEALANATRADYIDEGPWHDKVAEYIKGRKHVVSASEVYEAIFKCTPTSKKDTNEIMATLRRLGCSETRKLINGVSRRVFITPTSSDHLKVIK